MAPQGDGCQASVNPQVAGLSAYTFHLQRRRMLGCRLSSLIRKMACSFNFSFSSFAFDSNVCLSVVLSTRYYGPTWNEKIVDIINMTPSMVKALLSCKAQW